MKHRWMYIISLTATIFTIGSYVIPVTHAQGRSKRFPSGHRLDDTYGFLSFWEKNNGEQLLGEPVTVPLEENGLMVQYFERGRLEKHHELTGAPVMMGRIGVDYAKALWLVFEPTPAPLSRKLVKVESAQQPVEAIGRQVGEQFSSFWNKNGGITTFGYPISDPLWTYVGDKVILVQYFERGRLELHKTSNGLHEEVRISALGRDLAKLRKYNTEPEAPVEARVQPPPHTPTPTPGLVVASANEPLPTPAEQFTDSNGYQASAVPASFSSRGKHIIVSLSKQWLYAYEGENVVFDAPVSTGRDGFNTPVGSFSIYAKIPVQTMSGVLGGEAYNVPNVPDVMYIYGGVALHGTYWHNMFGTGVRMSHGCINLPIDSASWLYQWASVGTPVHVQY